MVLILPFVALLILRLWFRFRFQAAGQRERLFVSIALVGVATSPIIVFLIAKASGALDSLTVVDTKTAIGETVAAGVLGWLTLNILSWIARVLHLGGRHMADSLSRWIAARAWLITGLLSLVAIANLAPTLLQPVFGVAMVIIVIYRFLIVPAGFGPKKKKEAS